MVRNAASMQSLRDEMNNLSTDSPDRQPLSQPERLLRPSDPPLQTLDGSRATMQLCGDDAYTKRLMQKVAMGQATEEEVATFNNHVNKARSLPSIQNLVQRPDEEACMLSRPSDLDLARLDLSAPPQQPPSAFPSTLEMLQQVRKGQQELKQNFSSGSSSRQSSDVTRGPPSHVFGNSARKGYQMQLEMLAEQNRKRLLRARQEQDFITSGYQKLHEFTAPQAQHEQRHREIATEEYMGTCRGFPKISEETRQQMIKEREEAIQKDPSLANCDLSPEAIRRDMEAYSQEDWARMIQDAVDHDNRRQKMIEKEQRDMHYGTAESTWERERNPALSLVGTQTLAGKQEFDRLWRQFEAEENSAPRRSKGLAATQAANDEALQALRFKQATRENASKYTKPFCKFLTDNPTVFHAVDALKQQLKEQGWTELSERESWDIKTEGHYFVERNGSSLIAFAVGANYKSGNGAAILAGHVDALTAKLKPVSQVPNKAGYLQLGVAPYAGALNSTWWDRDLGIGGRVHIREGDKIVTKLVKLDWPIAKIPTLAPHFGAAAAGPFDKETQMVPIIGLDSSDTFINFDDSNGFSRPPIIGSAGRIGSFVETQPPALVKVIAEALGLNASSGSEIVNWELELFDVQPATVGGINKEFIFAGRIDDKLCSWAALQALIDSEEHDTAASGIIRVVGLFDDEEIGSLLRQGAKGNFLPSVMERAVGSLAGHHPNSDLMGRTYANSFMVSSDVTHAVNPNFLGAYLENHAPHLNVGIAIGADSNGHLTTDSVSTTILKRCADKVGAKLQVFQIRNGTPSGGTVGPMLSSAIGVRSIDAGLPQLSMHSIRATTGALDPGLGVLMFTGFLNGFEAADKEFQG